MRIGLINQLHGRPGADGPALTWEAIAERASLAERVGFDVFVFEDALLYRGETVTDGCWEAVSVAAALAAVTSRIHIGPSVFNAPYRSPALLAKVAETIDEISGGRFVLGIGAGNTPDSDYRAFGFPIDHRFSRFEEAIQIIHGLLRDGRVDFDGKFHSARDSEMILRGPRPQGPPINIAAGSPKMISLTARYADAWNWWAWGESEEDTRQRIGLLVDQVDSACEEEGRDPATLGRTFDLYTVVAPGYDPDGLDMDHRVVGSAEEIAERLLSLRDLGFDEVRCDIWPKTPEAIEAMLPVVEVVHAA
jgi:alkanesulfonate monooxygenase SsuD/methylene tetrahydromethanopterin reductase-like flavin-dependent oxidoreductase (luciferase family)